MKYKTQSLTDFRGTGEGGGLQKIVKKYFYFGGRGKVRK
jgi:hypothetical protein